MKSDSVTKLKKHYSEGVTSSNAGLRQKQSTTAEQQKAAREQVIDPTSQKTAAERRRTGFCPYPVVEEADRQRSEAGENQYAQNLRIVRC